jgi:hypothetical protein
MYIMNGFCAVGALTAYTVICQTLFTQGWSIPYMLSSGGNGKEIFSASIAVGAAIFVAPLTTPAAMVDVTGSYSDPNHPNCQRIIQANKESPSDFVLTGTDGNPGCSPDGIGQKTFQLVGKVDNDANIYVDFSPKGGPKDLKGLYDVKLRAITWPDGNVWSLKN